MSTIDVANLTDAESTTTNSANANDNLNNTTTVDTKYITNGCAKVFGSCRADGTIYTTSGATLNISSTSTAATGDYTYNFANDLNNPYPAVSDVAGTNDRSCQVKQRNAGYVIVKTRIGSTGVATDNANSVSIAGELA